MLRSILITTARTSSHRSSLHISRSSGSFSTSTTVSKWDGKEDRPHSVSSAIYYLLQTYGPQNNLVLWDKTEETGLTDIIKSKTKLKNQLNILKKAKQIRTEVKSNEKTVYHLVSERTHVLDAYDPEKEAASKAEKKEKFDAQQEAWASEMEEAAQRAVKVQERIDATWEPYLEAHEKYGQQMELYAKEQRELQEPV